MTEELRFLIDVVREATKITEKQFNVKSKGDGHDLVTNLDLEI